jgi:hypothetical protein
MPVFAGMTVARSEPTELTGKATFVLEVETPTP